MMLVQRPPTLHHDGADEDDEGDSPTTVPGKDSDEGAGSTSGAPEEDLRRQLAAITAELEACRRERDDLLRRHLRLQAKYRALKYRPPPPSSSSSSSGLLSSSFSAMPRHLTSSSSSSSSSSSLSSGGVPLAMPGRAGGVQHATRSQQQQQQGKEEVEQKHSSAVRRRSLFVSPALPSPPSSRRAQPSKASSSSSSSSSSSLSSTTTTTTTSWTPGTSGGSQGVLPAGSKLPSPLEPPVPLRPLVVTRTDQPSASSSASTSENQTGATTPSLRPATPSADSSPAPAEATTSALRNSTSSSRRLLAEFGLETSASAALTGGASASVNRPREGDADNTTLLGAAHRIARSSQPPITDAAAPKSSVKAHKERSEESEYVLFDFDELGTHEEEPQNFDDSEDEAEMVTDVEGKSEQSEHSEMAIYASSLPVIIPRRWVASEDHSQEKLKLSEIIIQQPESASPEANEEESLRDPEPPELASPDENTFMAPHLYSLRTTSVFDDLPRSISYRPYWKD